jgi:hypothetical protein
MSEIIFESHIDEVQPNLVRKLVRQFDIESRWVQSYIREQHMSGPTAEGSISVRSGTLRASVMAIKATIEGESINAGVSMGGTTTGGGSKTPAGRYVNVQVGEFRSTVIFPKKGKYLTIPFPQEYTTRTGKVMKPPAVISRQTSGKFIAWRKVKSVTVPARVHPSQIVAAWSLKVIGDLQAIGMNIMGV